MMVDIIIIKQKNIMNQYKVCVSVKKTKNTLSNTISLKKMFLVLTALNSALVCYD